MRLENKEITRLDEDSTQVIYQYDKGDIITTIDENGITGNFDVYPYCDANEWIETLTLKEAKKALKEY